MFNEMMVHDMIRLNLNVPVVLENFCCLPSTKLCSRHFMLSAWLTIQITNIQNLYTLVHGCCQLGVLLHSLDTTAHTRRMMFHVQDNLSHCSGPTYIHEMVFE